MMTGRGSPAERLLLITPVKNEAEFLPRVKEAIERQTVVPTKWVLVDDGSDDETPAMCRRWADGTSYIEFVQTCSADAMSVDPHTDGASPRAFNHALRSVGDWESYSYIGRLDGDVVLPPDYFEEILKQFVVDPVLGICGGRLFERRGPDRQILPIPAVHVHGAVKLYSRECIVAIGGVQEQLAWDIIDETVARMRGFRTSSPGHIVAEHLRPWGSAGGTLRGRQRHGAAAYIACSGPLWAVGRAAKIGATLEPRVVSGAAFLSGYMRAAMSRTGRADEPGFRQYVRDEHRARLREFLAAAAGRRR